jgi:hypothetical protein
MPTIKEYDAPVDQLRPNTGGEEAYAMEGRRVGAFYHQMGQDVGGTVQQLGAQYVQHQTDEEKRQLLVSSVQLEQGLHDGWQTFANDPKNAGRVDLAQAYMKQAQQQVDDWSSHAQTREGKLLAASRSADIENHLFEKVSGEQATITANHAINQADQLNNSLQAKVAGDMSQADSVISNADKFADTMFPRANIDPAARAEAVEKYGMIIKKDAANTYYNTGIEHVREDYAKGGATSSTENQLRKDLASGRYGDFLGEGRSGAARLSEIPDEIEAAKRQGQEEFRAGQAAGQKQQEQELKSRAVAISTGLSDMIANPGSFSQPNLDKLIQERDKLIASGAGGIIPGEINDINTMIRDLPRSMADHSEVATNQSVYSSVTSRISIPAGQPGYLSPAELLQHRGKDISDSDWGALNSTYNELHKAGGDPAYKAAFQKFDGWRKQVVASILGQMPSPDQRAIAAQFESDSLTYFNDDIAALHDPAKAADAVVNANNPNHFSSDVYIRAGQGGATLHDFMAQPGYKAFAAANGISMGGAPAAPGAPAPAKPGAADTMSDAEIAAKYGGR